MMLDESVKIGIEERYVNAWEKARLDQNTMIITKEETGLIDKLKRLGDNAKIDNRVNNEISTYLLLEISVSMMSIIFKFTNQFRFK